MKINFEELESEREKNFEERLKFVSFWVDYIKVHKDEEWSEQQNIIVNSQMN